MAWESVIAATRRRRNRLAGLPVTVASTVREQPPTSGPELRQALSQFSLAYRPEGRAAVQAAQESLFADFQRRVAEETANQERIARVRQLLLSQQADQEAQRENELQGIVRSFAPRRPSANYMQGAIWRGVPLDEMEEEARLAEGRANLRRYSADLEHMTPFERESMGPLKQELMRERLDPEELVEVINLYRKSVPNLANVPPEKRRAINRVLDRTGLAAQQDLSLGPQTRGVFRLPEDDAELDDLIRQREEERSLAALRERKLDPVDRVRTLVSPRRAPEPTGPRDIAPIEGLETQRVPGGVAANDPAITQYSLDPIMDQLTGEVELARPLTEPIGRFAASSLTGGLLGEAAERLPVVGDPIRRARNVVGDVGAETAAQLLVPSNIVGPLGVIGFADSLKLLRGAARLPTLRLTKPAVEKVAQAAKVLVDSGDPAARDLADEVMGRIRRDNALDPEYGVRRSVDEVEPPVPAGPQHTLVVPTGKKQPPKGGLVARANAPSVVFGEVTGKRVNAGKRLVIDVLDRAGKKHTVPNRQLVSVEEVATDLPVRTADELRYGEEYRRFTRGEVPEPPVRPASVATKRLAEIEDAVTGTRVPNTVASASEPGPRPAILEDVTDVADDLGAERAAIEAQRPGKPSLRQRLSSEEGSLRVGDPSPEFDQALRKVARDAARPRIQSVSNATPDVQERVIELTEEEFRILYRSGVLREEGLVDRAKQVEGRLSAIYDELRSLGATAPPKASPSRLVSDIMSRIRSEEGALRIGKTPDDEATRLALHDQRNEEFAQGLRNRLGDRIPPETAERLGATAGPPPSDLPANTGAEKIASRSAKRVAKMLRETGVKDDESAIARRIYDQILDDVGDDALGVKTSDRVPILQEGAIPNTPSFLAPDGTFVYSDEVGIHEQLASLLDSDVEGLLDRGYVRVNAGRSGQIVGLQASSMNDVRRAAERIAADFPDAEILYDVTQAQPNIGGAFRHRVVESGSARAADLAGVYAPKARPRRGLAERLLKEEGGALRVGGEADQPLRRGGAFFITPDDAILGGGDISHTDLFPQLGIPVADNDLRDLPIKGISNKLDVRTRGMQIALDAGHTRVYVQQSELVPGRFDVSLTAPDREALARVAKIVRRQIPEASIHYDIGLRGASGTLAPGSRVAQIRAELGSEEGALRVGRGAGDEADAPLKRILPDIPDYDPAAARRPIAGAADAVDDASRVRQRLRSGRPPKPADSLVTEPSTIDLDAIDPKLVDKETKAAFTLRNQINETGNSTANKVQDVLMADQKALLRDGKMEVRDGVLDLHVRRKGRGGPVSDKPPAWNDVAEDPDAYVFESPEVREFIDRAHAYMQGRAERMGELGLGPKLDAVEPSGGRRYFKRVVVEIDGNEVRVGPRGRIGTKQSVQKPRTREFAGQDDRVKYLQDPAGTVAVYLRESYRIEADAAVESALKKYEILERTKVPSSFRDAPKAVRTEIKSLERRIATARAKRFALNQTRKELRGTKTVRAKAADEILAKRQLLDEQIETMAEELATVKPTLKVRQKELAEVRRIARQPRVGREARIDQPFAQGKLYPETVARAVERAGSPEPVLFVRGKEYPIPGGKQAISVLRTVADVNNLLRPMWATGDLSYHALQSLAVAGRNPGAWLKATGRTLDAIRDPKIYYEFTRNNEGWIDDLIEDGGLWLGTDDIFEVYRGQPHSKITALFRRYTGQKIAQDSWNRDLNMLALEQYKQGRAIIDQVGEGPASRMIRKALGEFGDLRGPTARRDLVSAIMHGTGRLSADEIARQGEFQRLAMQALPFAGRYWLAWGKLVGDATRGGMRGNASRGLIAGWLTTGVGMYSLISWQRGQEPILDPRNPDLMTVEIGGIRVGVGGPLQQTWRTIGKLVDDPTNAGNTLAQFARGRSSPAISMTWDVISGETFLGDPIDSWSDVPSYVISRFAGPLSSFTLQETTKAVSEGLLEGDVKEAARGGLATIKQAPGTFLGLRAFPVSPFSRLRDARDDATKALYPDYESFDDLRNWSVASAYQVSRRPDVQIALQAVEAVDTDISPTDRYFDLVETRRSQVMEEQAQDDKRLYDGAISGSEWRESRRVRLASYAEYQKGAAEQAEVRFDDVAPPGSPNEVINAYFALDPQEYADPVSGRVDWSSYVEAQERLLAQLAPHDRRDMDAYLERFRTEAEITYSEDVDALDAAGWFDISDQVWAQIRRENPGSRLPTNIDSYRRRVVADFTSRYGADEAKVYATKEDDWLDYHADQVRELRGLWIERARPSLIRSLDKWGFRPLSETSLPELQDTEGEDEDILGDILEE